MPATVLRAAVRHDLPQAEQVPLHRHPQHELVLVLRGRLRVSIPTGLLEGRAGTVQIFPAGVVHDQASTGSWSTICLLCESADPLFAQGAQALAIDDGLLRGWFRDAVALHQAGSAEDRRAADALLVAILARLGRFRREADEQAAQPPALRLALDHLEARVDRDLDLRELCAAAGCSRSRLGELFRRHLGRPPLRHHARLRLERAQTLLANPYASVGAVAAQLGYGDLNWFVRRFRAEFGQPPGRWRAQACGPLRAARA